jgi:hypothetical protein
MPVPIPPGEARDFDFELTKVCRFAEVGTYRIVVSKEIWPEGWPSNAVPFSAKSGSLHLTVAPGRWEGNASARVPLHW